jgi:hypothetical protein
MRIDGKAVMVDWGYSFIIRILFNVNIARMTAASSTTNTTLIIKATTYFNTAIR